MNLFPYACVLIGPSCHVLHQKDILYVSKNVYHQFSAEDFVRAFFGSDQPLYAFTFTLVWSRDAYYAPSFDPHYNSYIYLP